MKVNSKALSEVFILYKIHTSLHVCILMAVPGFFAYMSSIVIKFSIYFNTFTNFHDAA